MPYGGEKNQAQVRKIESCVKQLQGKYGKQSAIRICKSKILKSSKGKK